MMDHLRIFLFVESKDCMDKGEWIRGFTVNTYRQ